MGIGHLFALAIHASVFDLLLGHYEIVALSTDPDPEQHLGLVCLHPLHAATPTTSPIPSFLASSTSIVCSKTFFVLFSPYR